MDLLSFLNAVYHYDEFSISEIDDFEIETTLDEGSLNTVLEFIFKKNSSLAVEPFYWVVDKIKGLNISLDVVDDDGNTALHIIAKNLKKIGNSWRNDLAEYLIKNGADYTIKNKDGLTAIEIATQKANKFNIDDWIIKTNLDPQSDEDYLIEVGSAAAGGGISDS